MKNNDYIPVNKHLWNMRVEHHIGSDFYNVDAFLRGKNSLNSIELELLGDVTNKKLLHLMCHFGQDSLSLARMGARVTGVDFSDQAIKQAEALNKQLKLNATFIESDVYNLKEKCHETFDLVFMSYGVLGWLPDIPELFRLVKGFLKSGGKLILAEFHPVMWMFNDNFNEITYAYHSDEPIIEESVGTYTDERASFKAESYGWNHGLAHVIDSLIKLKFDLETFEEFDYSPYNCFNGTVEISEGKWQIKGMEGKLPMVYALSAIKP